MWRTRSVKILGLPIPADFSKELKQSNIRRQLNNIYSFAVKRNSFSLKHIIRVAFIQMEAYRPYLQVLQGLLQRSFISGRAVALQRLDALLEVTEL